MHRVLRIIFDFFFYSLFKVDITKIIVVAYLQYTDTTDWFDVISFWRYHQKKLTVILTKKVLNIHRYT